MFISVGLNWYLNGTRIISKRRRGEEVNVVLSVVKAGITDVHSKFKCFLKTGNYGIIVFWSKSSLSTRR